ncbi:MAG: lipopolysaccharide heptosyltransferase II [Phycisphaerales bacterium]|nr:lipopolysaccharide heptosyltransferase II [Phycisphaerales bacterium]
MTQSQYSDMPDTTAARQPSRPVPARILIVLPKWVGDVVMATPALRALREQLPKAHITWLVRSPLAEIVDGCDWMDEVIRWPTKDKSRVKRRQGFLGLAATLREGQYDCAILLANSFRSALLTRLAGIKRRVGYDRDGRGMLLTDKLLPAKCDGRYLPVPMIRYYNAVARYMGCRECPELPELVTTPAEESAAATVLEQAGARDGQPVVLLNPDASFGPAKRWLPERFAEVADRLIERYDAVVLISCGPKETHIARKVAEHMRKPAFVMDQPVIRLGPSKALVRRASLLITNDTGPRHFAIALGTPVVTIFGPTHQEWTANAYPQERRIALAVDCGPCMKRTCPLNHHRCMTGISSDQVLAEAEALLSERLSSSSLPA